ncbi:MAG: 2-hydroxychromene-2-carboxylate isomerase [Rhodospirillales bacterium]|nr:2-hydroxychromene-2-carboxylate isomerase [Rhodospirillales bacterium]
MSDPIEFYFEFSSPYGYFAAQKIDQIAEDNGRMCLWKPFLLGAMFNKTGMAPLTHQPMRGEYGLHDWERLGRYMDVPWKMPKDFPVHSVAASRAFYWLEQQNPDQARLFAKSVYHAIFGEGIDISKPEVVADIAAPLFVDKDELLNGIQEQAIKDRLRNETDKAIERGVFGSPFFFVDGEGFWGSDRMWMVKKWLQSGGW